MYGALRVQLWVYAWQRTKSQLTTPSIETEQELSTEGLTSYPGHLLHSLGIRLVKSNSYISLFFYIHTTSEGQWILAADVVEHGGQ